MSMAEIVSVKTRVRVSISFTLLVLADVEIDGNGDAIVIFRCIAREDGYEFGPNDLRQQVENVIVGGEDIKAVALAKWAEVQK